VRVAAVYEKQKAKYVYTWEVFGDLKAHNDDCFKMFNPVTEADYEDNVNRWAAASIFLATEVVQRELGISLADEPSAVVAAATATPAAVTPLDVTDTLLGTATSGRSEEADRHAVDAGVMEARSVALKASFAGQHEGDANSELRTLEKVSDP
jgi:hypothetical protein